MTLGPGREAFNSEKASGSLRLELNLDGQVGVKWNLDEKLWETLSKPGGSQQTQRRGSA